MVINQELDERLDEMKPATVSYTEGIGNRKVDEYNSIENLTSKYNAMLEYVKTLHFNLKSDYTLRTWARIAIFLNTVLLVVITGLLIAILDLTLTKSEAVLSIEKRTAVLQHEIQNGCATHNSRAYKVD